MQIFARLQRIGALDQPLQLWLILTMKQFYSLSGLILAVFLSPLMAVGQGGADRADPGICPDGTHLPAAEPFKVGELKLKVSTVSVGTNAEGEPPVLNFAMTEDSARRFETYTAANIGQKVDFMIGDEVVMSPRINAVIEGGHGQISGNFTLAQLESFAARLVPICEGG